MFGVVSRLCDAAGLVPLIGDNDSGRICTLRRREDADQRYLLAWGATLFNDGALKMPFDADASDVLWLFGFSGMAVHQNLSTKGPVEPSDSVPSSGLVALRSERDVLVFSAQPNGADGVGHHTHNDKLSFTLSVEGIPFFIDPGTGVYTADPTARNRLRSTAMHNTAVIDDQEQNRLRHNDLFSLENDAQLIVDDYVPDERIVAAHTGYRRLSPPVTHRRIVELSKNLWRIDDRLDGSGEHAIQWNFVLGENIQAEGIDARHVSLKSGNVTLTFEVVGEVGPLEIGTSVFSPAYGEVRPTHSLRLRTRAQLPLSAVFIIRKSV
jgi:uncharacterized heparinase superfamily protein